MGILANKLIKSDKKRFAYRIIRDALFIIVFLTAFYNAKWVWDDGFMTAQRNCICYWENISASQFETELEIPDDCYKIDKYVYCPNASWSNHSFSLDIST